MAKKLLWDVYAATYDSGVNSLVIYKDLMSKVIKLVNAKPTDKIVDFGSGTGNFELSLIKNNQQFSNVTGLDISPEMILRAKSKIQDPRVIFLIHDITKKTPLANASFDKAVLIHSLYTVSDPLSLLKEAHRLLKPGGILIIANPYDKKGAKKISKAAFAELRFLQMVWLYLTKIPIIIINGLIARSAHKGQYHFIEESEMDRLLTASGFLKPQKYEHAYADTDLVFITSKI